MVALTMEARVMVHGSPMPAAAAVKVCHGGDLLLGVSLLLALERPRPPKKICDAAS